MQHPGQPPYQQPPYQQQYPQQPPPKKGTSPVVIVLAVLGAMVVLGFGGCVMCVGLGAKGVADQAKKEQEAKQMAKEDLQKVGLKELLSVYKANEVKGDGKYKGKYIETSGEVDDVKKDIVDQMYVTLGTGGAFEHPMVQCYFDKEHSGALSDLEKGQKITVRGHVKGLLFNVQLEECELVK